MTNDDERTRALLRIEARLEACEDLRAEFEPWRMEEREVAAREALDNVIAHLDAEIVELHRRRAALRPGARAAPAEARHHQGGTDG